MLALAVGLATAFAPPTSMQQLTRATVTPAADVYMMAARKPFKKNVLSAGRASPTKPTLKEVAKAKPLSPGSNYPTTKNIQTQKNGFGSFVQKFQKSSGKSKYGMPIFLPNGNVNPAYLAAERKDMAAQQKRNIMATEAKRKKLISNGQFELADFIRKKIGAVGSGKEYY